MDGNENPIEGFFFLSSRKSCTVQCNLFHITMILCQPDISFLNFILRIFKSISEMCINLMQLIKGCSCSCTNMYFHCKRPLSCYTYLSRWIISNVSRVYFSELGKGAFLYFRPWQRIICKTSFIQRSWQYIRYSKITMTKLSKIIVAGYLFSFIPFTFCLSVPSVSLEQRRWMHHFQQMEFYSA